MSVFLLTFMIILVMPFSYQKSTSMRESIVKSYVILFFLIAVSTEIASLFNVVTYHAISLFWVALNVISLLFAILLLKSSNSSSAIRKSLRAIAKYGVHERLFLLLVGFVLATTLLVALLAPPNNWDSMTYHMSRVVEWAQHKNIDFYPTSIDRQNYQMPLAEFAILHLQLLSHSDKFANIVQWYSLFIAILLSSLIAKEFQASQRVQFFSAVVVATIPMAILQSSSTQNDIILGAFSLGFAYFLLKLIRTLSFQNAFFCGLTLGLAMLTKGTAYIYCFAIGLIIGTAHLFSYRSRNTRWILLSKLALVILLSLVVNTGHLSRNYALYGHPLSTKAGDYMNEEFSATILFSNLIRNAALHLGTPSRHLNSYTYRAIEILLGNELNNPRTTWQGTHFKIRFSLHEDNAGNLLHFILIGLILIMLPVVKMDNKRIVYCYAGSVVFAAVLYSAVLKWQPWASRLHSSIFMLSAPLAGVVLSKLPSRRNVLLPSLAILLFIYSVPYLLLNQSRSLIPLRGYSVLNTNILKQYFVNRPYLYENYTAAVKVVMVEGKDEVGLYLGGNDWEYPLWVLADRFGNKGVPQFRHVGVTNISNTLEKQRVAAPVLVLATKDVNGNIIEGEEYVVIFESKHIRVLKLKDA